MTERVVALTLALEDRICGVQVFDDLSGVAVARVDDETGVYRLPLDAVSSATLRLAVGGEVDGRPILGWCRVLGTDPHLRLRTQPPRPTPGEPDLLFVSRPILLPPPRRRRRFR